MERMPDMRKEILRIDSLHKRIHNDALRHINFNLFEGEILGIIVRNDSQRHALFHVLVGALTQDSGQIYLHDREVRLQSRAHANRLGIYGISSRLSLIPNMSVAENFFISKNNMSGFGVMQRKLMMTEAQDLLRHTGLGGVSPSDTVKELSRAMQYNLEILKALSGNSTLLIVDDVTPAFTNAELQEFMRLMGCMRDQKVSVIFLSRRLNPLFDMVDRGVILHDGVTVDVLKRESLNRETVLPMLQGDLPTAEISPQKAPQTDVLLHAHLRTDRSKDFCFQLYQSEILGIYDEEWNHPDTLTNAFQKTGLLSEIRIEGKKVKLKSIRKAVQNGICLIDDFSLRHGFQYDRGLRENITLASAGQIHRPFGILRRNREQQRYESALKTIGREDLQTRFQEEKLSGKINKSTRMHLLVARWLCTNPKVMVFINPHLSFDDLTAEDFKKLIEHIRESGISVLIFSMDQKELLYTCDRILAL